MTLGRRALHLPNLFRHLPFAVDDLRHDRRIEAEADMILRAHVDDAGCRGEPMHRFDRVAQRLPEFDSAGLRLLESKGDRLFQDEPGSGGIGGEDRNGADALRALIREQYQRMRANS